MRDQAPELLHLASSDGLLKVDDLLDGLRLERHEQGAVRFSPELWGGASKAHNSQFVFLRFKGESVDDAAPAVNKSAYIPSAILLLPADMFPAT